MIYGIGTDLVDLDRIKKMKSLSAFAKKILGPQELEQYADLSNEQSSTTNVSPYLLNLLITLFIFFSSLKAGIKIIRSLFFFFKIRPL